MLSGSTSEQWSWLKKVAPIIGGDLTTEANRAVLVEPDGSNEVTIVFEAMPLNKVMLSGYRPIKGFEFARDFFCPVSIVVRMLIRASKEVGQWFVPTNDDCENQPPMMVKKNVIYKMVEISSTGEITDKPFIIREHPDEVFERVRVFAR